MAQIPATVDAGIMARARTPKGRKALQAILDATYELVRTHGLNAASQEVIAKRAGLTQSAVRHYFPRKSELLDAFFLYSAERLENRFREELAAVHKDPRSHLLSIAALHYDRILEVEDASYFETLSLWARTPKYRKIRNQWYHRVNGYYTDLIQAIHPEWDEERCTVTAFQLMTLVLGGWISLGSSRPLHPRRGRKALKAMLLEGVERLIA